MARKEHCGYCGCWYYPHPRSAGRQRCCGKPECRKRVHQNASEAWHKKHPHAKKQARLLRRLVKSPPPPKSDSPFKALDWEASMEEVGPGPTVLAQEVMKALLRWLRVRLAG